MPNLVYKPITEALPLENIKLGTVVDFLSYLLIKGKLIAKSTGVAFSGYSTVYQVPQGYTLFVTAVSIEVKQPELYEGAALYYNTIDQNDRFLDVRCDSSVIKTHSMTFAMPMRFNAGELIRFGMTYQPAVNNGASGRACMIGYLLDDADYREFRK